MTSGCRNMDKVNEVAPPRSNHLPWPRCDRVLVASTFLVISGFSLASMVYGLVIFSHAGSLPSNSRPDYFNFLVAFTSILFALLSAVIVDRLPGNRIAWVMAAIGGFTAVENLALYIYIYI